MDNEVPGTLKVGEFHPGANIAHQFLQEYMNEHSPFLLIESLASCAIEGNRMAEVCSETLRRYLNNEPVSDRYLMGLAWMVYKMNQKVKHD